MASYSFPWNTVNTLVGDYVVKNIYDQWSKSNAMLYRTKDRQKTFTGGRSIQVPLVWKPEGGGGQWISGADIIDTTVRDPVQMAVFTPKTAVVPITVTWEDEKTVMGPNMVKDLVETKGEIAKTTAIDLIGTDLFNDGTDAKRMTGFAYSLKDHTATGGVGSTPGIPSQTYGGITRQGLYGSSVAVSNYWIHQGDYTAYTDAAGGGGNFDPGTAGQVMKVLGKMWARIRFASGKSPTLLLSNVGSFTCYHNALSLNDRYMRPQQDTKMAEAGYENLKYKQAVWVIDERAPRTSANIEKIYFINEDAVRLYVHQDANFAFEPFRKPHNQLARIAYILWRGEMIVVEPRANGVISSVDTSASS